MSKKSSAKKAAAAAATAPVAKSQAQAPDAAGLPLFFKKPAIVDKARHAKAAIGTVADLGFARDTNSLPLNAIEFIEAAKSYPIVFTPDVNDPMPVAIVGWGQKNYFVDAKGKWADHYVPAYVRQYPFIFFQPPNSNKFFLCVDEAAPHYFAGKTEGAQPLYDAKGEPAPLAKRALEFCSSFYQHITITKALCADLQKHKLLQPYSSKAKLPNGKELTLSGFRMIDEKAFNELSQETFLEFRKKGWLGFIYLSLASASNWKRLMELAQTTK